MLKDYQSKRHLLSKVKTPALVLLELSGSWDDKRITVEIVRYIEKARRNSKKLSGGL
jgi:hypothetical protein